MCFPKNFEEVLRTPVLQNVDRLRYFYLLPGFKILANSLKNTCKGFHFCSNTAGYRIIRAVVCVFGLVTILLLFTINQFCTRNLQSIWFAVYLFLLFSIASAKLNKFNLSSVLLFFMLLSFLSFLSSPLDYCIRILIHSRVLLF